ncbi:MAG: YggS family pyridoxal phosphate-dependent enzyme [Phycisphaerae bacterium]|nr:YggS family pyridoxal phosphate-dependent enzyme [Phycisphaerae bacterium]NUQ47507.1 YggS family pyridoxal phosphate-dependent enzyme [Phycisphaerae bacterium]
MTTSSPSIKRRLADNLRKVRDRMEEACSRARRRPTDVTLVAVTKEVDIDVVRQCLESGLVDLGESRPQQLNQRAAMLHEFVSRRQALGAPAEGASSQPRWHLVGHLQRNKIKLVLPWTEMIHSVDSLRLAEDIDEHARKLGRVARLLLQVNTSGERSKFGVAVAAASHIAEHLRGLEGIRLCGLMTMAPLDATPDEIRLYFDRLRELFEDMRSEKVVGPDFTHLSMGMSSDFTIAIEAGATMIRLGHALFEGLATMRGEDRAGAGPVDDRVNENEI